MEEESITIEASHPDWLTLPTEIWSLIIGKLWLEDFIHCQSVSSFSMVRDLKLQCNYQPRVPWLLHSVNKENQIHAWELFDMTNNKMYIIDLPELLYTTILGSSEGWLILLDKTTADLQLFNPFTRAQIPLLPTISFPGIVGADRNSQGHIEEYHVLQLDGGHEFRKFRVDFFWRNFFRSATMASSCKNSYTVVVQHRFGGSGVARIRDGMAAWTSVQVNEGYSDQCNFLFFKGLLYVMDLQGRLLSFDLEGPLPPSPVQVAPPAPDMPGCIRYLVMSHDDEGPLLLLKYREGIFRAFKQKTDGGEWVEVSRLFGHSLFSRLHRSSQRSLMSLCGKDHPAEVKRNCFYFMLRLHGNSRRSIEQQGMEDGRIINSFALGHPMPGEERVWISPVLGEKALTAVEEGGSSYIYRGNLIEELKGKRLSESGKP